MRKQYFELHILELVHGYMDNHTYHFYNKTTLENELKDIIVNYEENYNEPISISVYYFDEIEIFGQLIKQDVKKVFEWHK